LKSLRLSLIKFLPLWLLLFFPVVALVAAVIIWIGADHSNPAPEITSIPSPAPVTFIPPTPLPTEPEAASSTGVLDQPMPELALTTLEGASIDLHDLHGQVIFLNFWATWCVPCQDEMPALQTFQDEHNNVVVIGVTDPTLGQTEDDIRAFVEAYQLTFPIALSSDQALYIQFDILQLPTTFIIDPQGIVRYRHIGALTADDLTGYLSLLTS
jgi:peroxiredoxin